MQQLAAGEASPHEAVVQIEKDLLDAFQARLFTNLDEATQAAERGFDGRFAETAAIVQRLLAGDRRRVRRAARRGG